MFSKAAYDKAQNELAALATERRKAREAGAEWKAFDSRERAYWAAKERLANLEK